MTRARRAMAGTIVSGLALSGLVLATPSTAHAEEAPAPTLKWKVSQQFKNNIGARVYTGATENAEGVITFPNGVGTHDSGSGVTSVKYSGTVDASFNFPGTTTRCYTITIANPSVEIDASGAGKIVADVSSDVPAVAQCGTSVASSTPVTRVTVTTFTAGASAWTNAAAGKSLTATPDFVGVLPPNTEQAIALTGTTDRPYNGESFAPSFLGAIAPGTRSHFYRTAVAASQPNKFPSEFTAEAPKPSITATQVEGQPTKWAVAGKGFTRATNPGDAGVYAGIAPVGGMPDVSNIANISLFAGVAAYFGTAIDATTGALGSTITLDPEKLDPTKDYSVYTWRAHTHSTTSQDTETPIDIDFGAIKTLTTTTISAPAAAVGTDATVEVAVSDGGTGSVTLKGAGDDVTADVVEGKATFTLSGLALGEHDLTAAYSGSTTHWKSSDTETLTIGQSSSTTKLGSVATHSYGNAVTLSATVAGATTGSVSFYEGETKLGSGDIAGGKATLKLPATLKVGTHKVKASFDGSTNVATSTSGVVTFIVKKVGTTTSASITKPTTKAAGKVTVAVRSAAGTSVPKGTVAVVLTKGKETYTVRGTLASNGRVTVKVPKVKVKGTWRVTARFGTSATHVGSFTTYTVTIK